MRRHVSISHGSSPDFSSYVMALIRDYHEAMRLCLVVCFAGLLFGQGTEPKHTAEEYDVHGQSKKLAIGAEFMVHSFSRGEQTFIAKDYLVVEVALFPAKGETFTVTDADFTLRINGKKQVLEPASTSMVVASLQHPEWEQAGGMRPEVGGQMGNVGVMMGGPRSTNPFPGSNAPGAQLPPRVPVPQDTPGGVEKAPPVKAEDVANQTALVEGDQHTAVSGFLYFPFRGKIDSIKTLELVYRDAVLKLR